MSNRALAFAIIFLLVADIVAGTIGVLKAPILGANTCTTSNNLCGPISFDGFVFGNSTAIDVTQLTSQAHQMIPNETIVLVARGEVGTVKVSSVADTALDNFSRNVYVQSGDDFEIWTAVSKTVIVNTITVTWNASNNAIFGASYYFNARGVGNATGTTGLASPASTTLETTQGGSWIAGAAGISGSCSAFTVTVGVFRGQSCNSSVQDNVIVAMDNNTNLANKVFATLQASYSQVAGFDSGSVELLAVDNEPNNPNFNHFCTDTNGLCITTQYSINQVARASFSNAVNKALALNTAYCTGITTSPLTTTLNHAIDGRGEYSGVDLNQTGARLLMQFYISTNVPSTVFASGLCASGGSVIGTATIYFSTSGGLLASNVFAMPINGFSGAGTLSGTYYGWFEITAENFAVGSMGWDQTTGGACVNVCLYIINMMEIK